MENYFLAVFCKSEGDEENSKNWAVAIVRAGEIVRWKASCLHNLDGSLLDVGGPGDDIISFDSGMDTDSPGGMVAQFISELLSPYLCSLTNKILDEKKYWEEFIRDSGITFKEESSITMVYNPNILEKGK